MTKHLNSILIGLLGSFSAVFKAEADLEVSTSVQIHSQADFYAPLSEHGAWVEVGGYGRCWRPANLAVEWRPYCYGHWVWTDCGWYWASDEPWGWACYHYGSWVYTDGWIWVPGVEWGPAWVSWRTGGGYIGWAPLPPPHVVVGAHFGTPPVPFVFVEANRFHEPLRPSTVIVNNTTIIRQTTEINNIKRETRTLGTAGSRTVVVNEGPGLEKIQSASGHKVSVVPIQEAARQAPAPSTLKHGKVEPRQNERPPGAVEQPQPNPEVRPGQTERRPFPEAPYGNPSGAPKGKGEGQGQGHGRGHEKEK